MERKTKHRILGIFVVIGLVIILLPFFQAGKESTSTANLVKAPPFPDQSVQVSASEASEQTSTSIPIQPANPEENPTKQQPDDTINPNKSLMMNPNAPNTTPTATPAPLNAPAPAADTHTTSPSSNTEAPPSATTQSMNTPAVPAITANNAASDVSTEANDVTSDSFKDNSKSKTVSAIKNVVKPNLAHITSSDEIVEAPAIPKNKKVTHSLAKMARTLHSFQSRIKPLHITQLPINNNGLANLKQSVWVIQLGSFKNKTNALKLVNQLRAKGYRAFIQQVSSEMGQDSTRVFVGPENKQNTARELASELESSMHLHGIVISYQPLTL